MTAATGEGVCPKRCASDLGIGCRLAVSRRLGARLRALRRGAQSPSLMSLSIAVRAKAAAKGRGYLVECLIASASLDALMIRLCYWFYCVELTMLTGPNSPDSSSSHFVRTLS